MKRLLYFILFTVVLIAGLTFALKNSEPVEINYYFDLHWNGSLSVVLLVTLLLGSLAGFLGSLGLVLRMRHRLVRKQRELRKMEQEITNLRALPIKDVI